jgi:hypothetical protein
MPFWASLIQDNRAFESASIFNALEWSDVHHSSEVSIIQPYPQHRRGALKIVRAGAKDSARAPLR